MAYQILERMVSAVKELEMKGVLKVAYRSIEIDEERKQLSIHLTLSFDEASWVLLFEEENKPKTVKLEFTEGVKTEDKVSK